MTDDRDQGSERKDGGEMSHTPGPWKIHSSMGAYGEHHNIVRADDEDIGRVGFVELFAPTDGDMEKEGTANARLIAAAPDQNAVCLELDRLSLVIESAVRNADPGNLAMVDELLRSNRAALAKARET